MNKFLKNLKKGFTLVELLVVMGILGVLAAGLIALINPADRVRFANDTKVKADVAQLVTATLSWSATNDGVFPLTAAWSAAIVPAELTVMPTSPYTAYAYSANAGGSAFKISGQLQSVKNGGSPATPFYWIYCSWTGNYRIPSATAPNATFIGACQ